MDLTSIKNIKNKYISALTSDPKYKEVISNLMKKKYNEPIYSYNILNAEEPPDFSQEEREYQELLLDLTAINNSIIETKNYADSIIKAVDEQISNIEEILTEEEDRLQDINMICSNEEYNMVIRASASDFDGDFEESKNKIIGADISKKEQINYQIVDISGNGVSGNMFVYNNDKFENETNDYSSVEYITDESDITAYEYERLVTTDKKEVRDGIINYDNKPVECVITIATDNNEACRMELLSDTKDLQMTQLEISDDGVNWTKYYKTPLYINSLENEYEDSKYIYGSGFVCFPYTRYLKISLSSNELLNDTIAYKETGESNKIVKCENTKRKKIQIKNIKLYSSSYNTANITSRDFLKSGSTDKIALFVSEYIPDHFTINEPIKYYLIINGKEYNVQPINSGREGIKIIKYSEVTELVKTLSDVQLIDETIKSAKIRITIEPNNGEETPYISNIKLILAKDTGSAYVNDGQQETLP